MKDNLPSMRLFKGEGFKLHRTLLMPAIAVRKEMDVSSEERIRPAQFQDLTKLADLLNLTWQGHELYEPVSAETLEQSMRRTPAFDYNDLLVLEKNSELLACLGGWDWSKVMRVTVKSLSRKLRMIGWILTTTRILARFPKPGDTMKQMMLIFVGFKDLTSLSALIRHLNNNALREGMEQIFCICERGDVLLKSIKGFIRVDSAMHLYTKPLAQNVSMAGMPVFVNGIDL
jgi:hypothetical protein